LSIVPGKEESSDLPLSIRSRLFLSIASYSTSRTDGMNRQNQKIRLSSATKFSRLFYERL